MPYVKKLIKYTYERGGPVKYIHEGYIENGLRTGQGTSFYTDAPEKPMYIGLWFNDCQHGKGKIFHKNGVEACEGTWVNGKLCGYARYFDDKGRILYDGMFYKGEKHGFGITYYYADNTVELPSHSHNGFYCKGKKHGQGTIKYRSGDQKQSFWHMGTENDSLTVETKRIEKTKGVYEGETFDGIVHGKGSLTYHNNVRVCQSIWIQGQLCGNDVVYFNQDGTENFKGSVWNGKKHGKVNTFTYDSPEGTSAPTLKEYCIGWYADGKKHGPATVYDAYANKIREEVWLHGTCVQTTEINPNRTVSTSTASGSTRHHDQSLTTPDGLSFV